MKKIYKTPMMLAVAKNIHKENNIIKYDREDMEIGKNLFVYYNHFGRLLTVDNNFPVTYLDDTEGLIQHNLDYCQDRLPDIISYPYINPDNLTLIEKEPIVMQKERVFSKLKNRK